MRMYCRLCLEPHEIKWIRPSTCPVCLRPLKPEDWLERNDPASAWELYEMDKRFLKSLHIDPTL